MIDDYKPIIVDTDWGTPYINLYFLHDLHYGNQYFDCKKWNRTKDIILADPYAKVIWIGDMMENAVPNSKSDVFYQTVAPHEQKMWLRDQMLCFGDKNIAAVPGNHERNRSTKTAGMFPVYDACVMANIEPIYREHFALIDIGVGTRTKSGKKQQHVRYVGYITHKAVDQKKFHSADAIDGIDFYAYGHDHQPSDHPRGKLVYDPIRKELREKDIEIINCGAYLRYGGYSVDAAYRPPAQKQYIVTLRGGEKLIDAHRV